MNGIELVNIYRGQIDGADALEASHLGSIAVVNGDGELLYALGDVFAPTHLRSTAKPFQLLPFMRRGLEQKFALDDAEVALLMASHGGEPDHVERLKTLMGKLLISGEQLLCGVHAPMHDASKYALIKANEKPTVLHNNCSGKHCAMIAVSKEQGWTTENYIDIDHPLQEEIARLLIDLSGAATADLGVGIDGCSAPTFILPLTAIARLYANLAVPTSGDETKDEALRKLFAAGAHHPSMIAGSKRLDTLLMQCAKGQLFAKTGADGVYAMAVAPSRKYPRGLGIAMKITDGDSSHRARNVAAVSVLIQLGVISHEELSSCVELSHMAGGDIKNLRGLLTGSIRPVFVLK